MAPGRQSKATTSRILNQSAALPACFTPNITPAASTVRVPGKIKKKIKRRAIPVAQNGTDKLPWAGATCYEAVKPECIRCMQSIL